MTSTARVSPPPPLQVLVPMSLEARAVRAGAPWTDVQRIGVGQRRAARTSRHALRPNAIPLLAGFCGALDDDLAPGDVVLASEVRSPAGATRCADPALLARTLELAGFRVHVGPVVTVARPVFGRGRAAMRNAALAADMESAAVARLLGPERLSVLRVVLDTPSAELRRPLRLAAAARTAYRTLKLACSALEDWARALGQREIVLAAPRASCAGVERAIEIVERALADEGPPVYVRKQIVHNAHVIADLERRGAIFVEEVDQAPAGSTVIFSAHGVSPEVRRQARERDLDVIDATCPLVSKVHAEARHFSEDGYEIVLVGHAGHEEVEGTLGEAPERMHLVASRDDVHHLAVADPSRVAYLTQTTLALDETKSVVDALRQRFPALAGPRSSDICYATQNRQDAVRALVSDCDIVLVVGSGNSSNSRRLVEVAERAGARALLVEDASAIPLRAVAGARRVGVTAGASAPEALVGEVVSALSGLGPVELSERRVAREDIRFKLPVESRGRT